MHSNEERAQLEGKREVFLKKDGLEKSVTEFSHFSFQQLMTMYTSHMGTLALRACDKTPDYEPQMSLEKSNLPNFINYELLQHNCL